MPLTSEGFFFLTNHQTFSSSYFMKKKKPTPTCTPTARQEAYSLPWSALWVTRKSVCPSISLYWPFALSLQQLIYPTQQKATAPGPLCFDQVEANHWSVGAGSWWYGLIWPSVTGIQTVGTAAKPWQSCYFLTKWLKLRRLLQRLPTKLPSPYS